MQRVFRIIPSNLIQVILQIIEFKWHNKMAFEIVRWAIIKRPEQTKRAILSETNKETGRELENLPKPKEIIRMSNSKLL